MRVSDPLNDSVINCTMIEMYTSNSFLKVTMSVQGLFGALSLLSMALTMAKILKTAMIDRAFKEYILTSYIVQFFTCGAMALLQTVLLYHFLFSSYCEAYISATLCYSLRMITSANSILPLLNVALTLFRFCALRNTKRPLRSCLWIHRLLLMLAVIAGVSYHFFKFADTKMEGYVVYCIANKHGDSLSRTLQNVYTSVCELFSVLFGILLFRSYKNSDRTFNVNSSLIRRQVIQTFHLFISYTICQGISFCAYGVMSVLSRTFFTDVPEPTWSAGSGLLFVPMYFSTFSPWLIYCIIRREEKKRVESTNDLLTYENKGAEMHFRRLREQWNAPPGQTTENDQSTEKEQSLKKKIIERWRAILLRAPNRVTPAETYNS